MDAALVRRCEERVAALPIPRPWDLRELLRRIGELRGKPIMVIDALAGPAGSSGMWVSLASVDAVYVERCPTVVHREHIVLHQVGHMLADHDGQHGALHAQVLGELMPSLDPAVVSRVLGHNCYAAEQEAEAELFATLVMRAGGAG